MVAAGLPGRIDGDEGCVCRHQAVFECHLLNLAGQVGVGVVSSLICQSLDSLVVIDPFKINGT